VNYLIMRLTISWLSLLRSKEIYWFDCGQHFRYTRPLLRSINGWRTSARVGVMSIRSWMSGSF